MIPSLKKPYKLGSEYSFRGIFSSTFLDLSPFLHHGRLLRELTEWREWREDKALGGKQENGGLVIETHLCPVLSLVARLVKNLPPMQETPV